MNQLSSTLMRLALRALRVYLVGRGQPWVFRRPAAGWRPPKVSRTSLYLHVPFCRNTCPYCPYTKVPYSEDLVEPYTRAALAEVDWWADALGPAEITSVYIGGGTPTVAPKSVSAILERIRQRFNLTGDICIETNPSDVNKEMVSKLHAASVRLVSLGVQSFRPKMLSVLGRNYEPAVAEDALRLLAKGGFASVNVDIMFALPGQKTEDVLSDLSHAARLGADQITTYPLFTFPYTSVGKYLKLKAVRMPDLRTRRVQYRAISRWAGQHGFERVSVWGFKRGAVPRYSSVTRDGYIGIGPGAGSHLPDGFVLNTFDLASWGEAIRAGRSAVALRLPFREEMPGWWWLYWRLYDTRIPLKGLDAVLGRDAAKARLLLRIAERAGLAVEVDDWFVLTDRGAFWLHLVQNYLALDYVNTLWTKARRQPWPDWVAI